MNPELEISDFLVSEEGKYYFLILEHIKDLLQWMFDDKKKAPIEIEQELIAIYQIPNIFSPIALKGKPEECIQDLSHFSNTELCLYFNKKINRNDFTEEQQQLKILQEFKNRKVDVAALDLKNPSTGLQYNLAHPIIWCEEIEEVKLLELGVKRVQKDKPISLGSWTTSQEFYEMCYHSLDQESDLDLVSSFNRQIEIQAWGNGRMGNLRALRDQFLKRNIDWSSIKKGELFNLQNCVVLKEKKLLRIGDIEDFEIEKCFQKYIKEVQPELEGSAKIVYSDFETIRFAHKKRLYDLPKNDLIQMKGRITFLKNIKS